MFTQARTPACESRPLFGQRPVFAAYRGVRGHQEVDQGPGPARVPSVPRGFWRPSRPRPVFAQRTQSKVQISVDFGRLSLKVHFHQRTTLKLQISVDFFQGRSTFAGGGSAAGKVPQKSTKRDDKGTIKDGKGLNAAGRARPGGPQTSRPRAGGDSQLNLRISVRFFWGSF